MAKFWTFVFLLIPVFGVAAFVAAPYYDHWLPRDVSSHGHTIDQLFMFILWLTGAVFIATELALVLFIFRYAHKPHQMRAVTFTHGSHSLEIIWTIIPCAVLLFIAIYQMNAWAASKIVNPVPGSQPLLEVTGRQFEWRLRYPVSAELRNRALGRAANDPAAEHDMIKDVFIINDLHVPVNEEVLLDLKSADVLHSFFLPNLRVKQDAVPGMKIPVWFRATDVGQFDLVCAELCGWGHYKMKGRITIESRSQFDTWLAQQYRDQMATSDPQTSQ